MKTNTNLARIGFFLSISFRYRLKDKKGKINKS